VASLAATALDQLPVAAHHAHAAHHGTVGGMNPAAAIGLLYAMFFAIAGIFLWVLGVDSPFVNVIFAVGTFGVGVFFALAGGIGLWGYLGLLYGTVLTVVAIAMAINRWSPWWAVITFALISLALAVVLGGADLNSG
jgi:hypothetical protein